MSMSCVEQCPEGSSPELETNFCEAGYYGDYFVTDECQSTPCQQVNFQTLNKNYVLRCPKSQRRGATIYRDVQSKEDILKFIAYFPASTDKEVQLILGAGLKEEGQT